MSLLSRYDSYDLLSKALLCPLSEDVRRITGKEGRALSASTPLIAADGTLVLLTWEGWMKYFSWYHLKDCS